MGNDANLSRIFGEVFGGRRFPSPEALLAGHAAVLFVLFSGFDDTDPALIVALVATTLGLPLGAAAMRFLIFAEPGPSFFHEFFVGFCAYVGCAITLFTGAGALLFSLAPWTVYLYVWPFFLILLLGSPGNWLGRRVGNFGRRFWRQSLLEKGFVASDDLERMWADEEE